MTLRTVTVCPDCQSVFTVKKTPETTTCRRCQSRQCIREYDLSHVHPYLLFTPHPSG